jgi:membrane-associated protease RseP (regulator of RpoE activity)
MTFKFITAGGPVIGNIQGSGTLNISGLTSPYTAKGTQRGIFEGGGGGRISGDAPFVISEPNQKDQSMDWSWEETLNADGTGNGHVVNKKNGSTVGTWSVTFSADEFQAALQGATPNATATSIAVVGAEVQLSQEVRNNIARCPLIDDATKALLNQDSVLILRDDNGQFYAINNQRKTIPLPVAVKNVFDITYEFGILKNNKLLDKAGYEDMRDDINGGSQADSLKKVPDDLKAHAYISITKTCSAPAQCRPGLQTTMTDPAFRASWRPSPKSENDIGFGDIRGSINGGGDFIYLPIPMGNTELTLLSIGTGRSILDRGNRPYLGVQVVDGSSGAIIKMVQKTLPAEQAGLTLGDIVTSVSGTPLDTRTPLAALIGQHAGGDQVELGIIRNGAPQSVPVTLAQLLPPMIVTTSAEITGPNDSKLVIDISFNGVTGILVLADTVHVREPLTGSEVDVRAGSMVVVVSGNEIGKPFPVSDGDIHAWWKIPSTTPATPESLVPTPGPNPSPDGSTLLVLMIGAGCLCVVVIVLIVIIVLVMRMKKQPLAAPPPYYPPQR